MDTEGLGYSTRKKLDTRKLRDMAQLEYSVCQVEHLKAEKARTNMHHKKEKVTYVETYEYLSNLGDEYVEESEVNMEELKPRTPSYVCKLLKPSNEKNLVEPSKNDKFVTKIYTFDITKYEEIFDLLVTNGNIIVPPGLKTPH